MIRCKAYFSHTLPPEPGMHSDIADLGFFVSYPVIDIADDLPHGLIDDDIGIGDGNIINLPLKNSWTPGIWKRAAFDGQDIRKILPGHGSQDKNVRGQFQTGNIDLRKSITFSSSEPFLSISFPV